MEFLSYRNTTSSTRQGRSGRNMNCESHMVWIGAKPAVWRDKFSSPSHETLWRNTRRSLLSLCMTFLFLFVLLVCRPIFDSAKRKTRSVSSHRFTVPSHSSLPRARIHPGRQFCAFSYGSFVRSKQANLSSKCDRAGFSRKSFVRRNFHCEIFRIDFPDFPLSSARSSSFYGSQELFRFGRCVSNGKWRRGKAWRARFMLNKHCRITEDIWSSRKINPPEARGWRSSMLLKSFSESIRWLLIAVSMEVFTW